MYSDSNWYQTETWQWAHFKGRCVRAERCNKTWRWWAEPNGADRTKCFNLKEAKAYVEEHGTDERELNRLV